MFRSSRNVLQDFATILPAERQNNFEVKEETWRINLVFLIGLLWCPQKVVHMSYNGLLYNALRYKSIWHLMGSEINWLAARLSGGILWHIFM